MTTAWKKDNLSSFIKEFIVPQRDKPKVFSGSTPWCRIEDIDGVYLSKSKSNQFVSSTTIEEMRLRVFPENTVIVSCSADLGRCAIIAKPLVTNQTFIGLVPSDNVIPQFLYYYMTNISELLNEMATGATIKYLPKKKFQELNVHFPPVPEQRRIVAILDEAFAAIAKAKTNAEQNLKNAKVLFESYLQGVFENKGDGWVQKKLGEVCEIVNGGTPDTSVSKYWNGRHLWITPKDMGRLNGIYVEDTSRKITDEGLENSSAKMLPINSIILSSRAPIGHLAINKKTMSTNQGCKGIVPKNGISNLFLYYFLSKSVELLNNLGTGTTFKELSGTKLASVEIYLPNMKIQQAIVDELSELISETQKLEAIYKQKLANLEELKKSILNKAFSGELNTSKKCA